MRVCNTNAFILSISIFPMIIGIVCGNAVRTVVYHDRNTEDSLSSSLEDIPPRQEWFRVRGQSSSQKSGNQVANHRSLTQQKSHAIADGERDIVVLPRATAITVTPARSFNNADYEDTQTEREHVIEADAELVSRDGTMQVNVNNRGRAGLQKNRGIKGSERAGDVYAPDEEWEEMSRVPPVSRLPPSQKGQRPQNWHLHIRHENGHQRVNMESRHKTNEMHSHQNDEDADETTSQRTPVDNDERMNTDDYDDMESPTKHATLLAVSRPDSSKRIVQVRPVTHSNDIRSSETSERRDASDDRDDSPPPHELVAKMARYIVHNSNWTSLATISTMSPVRGYPFVNIFSISDGPANNSSGIPYMYLTPLDMSVTDLESDSRTSLTMSLAQSDYCRQQQYDPEDPRCAHVILSGSIKPVTQKNEVTFARNAMFSKHPDMTDWPKDHGWFFAKLDIKNIVVLDYFGGAKTVTLNDYFNQTLL